ncbi:hypothetical protein LRS06_20600 [Hymenobacter sp. J193]|uniref:hypothetical protein n=1 Tax=Hymenobacter sp. J193 TaxID=2898429 RepID=UPI002151E52B|nr:hypothetical protein [Hymenobacter sp. J193]MCR5890130.1 hypothetical protein [Hymenobacter sp. J193]
MGQINWRRAYPELRVLDETPEFLLGHSFEDAILIRKRNGEHVLEDDFYGDPACGYISRTHKWAVVAGEHVTVWHSKRGKQIIPLTDRKYVHALRYVGESRLQLLVDPFGSHSAIWELNVETNDFRKVQDIPTCAEYTEEISW